MNDKIVDLMLEKQDGEEPNDEAAEEDEEEADEAECTCGDDEDLEGV